MRITILYDKPETRDMMPDHADVLLQVKSVKYSLKSLGHECTELGFTADTDRFSDELKHTSPDLVFNLVESVGGKGDLIFLAPAVLDTLNIPYTGSSTDSIYRTSNKLLAKEWLMVKGIPTPDYFSSDDFAEESVFIRGEYIIKSVWEHASIGIDDRSIIVPDSCSVLFHEMKRRKNDLGGRCFAEKYIDGREFNLSVLAGYDKPEVLPPAEIIFDSYGSKRKIVGYEAKWDQDSFEYHNTVRCFDFSEKDYRLLSMLEELSLRCWKIFRIRGYCRVDFRVDEQARPWVLEINANPCISPDAGFMAASERAGLKANDVVERIINDSIT